jgi:hypothetical protein
MLASSVFLGGNEERIGGVFQRNMYPGGTNVKCHVLS